MSDLGEDSRALIEAASGVDDPSTGDDLRMRRALTTRLGASIGLAVGATSGAASAATGAGAIGAATSGAASAATGAGATGAATSGAAAAGIGAGATGAIGTTGVTVVSMASGGILAKTLAVVAIVSAVSAGGAALIETHEDAPPSDRAGVQVVPRSPPPQSPLTPTRPAPALVASPVAAPASSTAVPPPAALAPAPPDPWPASRSAAAAPAPASATTPASTIANAAAAGVAPPPAGTPAETSLAASASTPPVQPAPDVAALDEESRLLREADQALRSHDGATALARLDEHARRFPRGVLAEERAGQRVLALCELGRVGEAKTAAAAFLSASPRSPLAPWVHRSCGEP